MELPFVDNKQNVSCIPVGAYTGSFRHSPKNGNVIEFDYVPDRQYIQIHSFNVPSESRGCIGVGSSITTGKELRDNYLYNSKDTLQRLLEFCIDQNSYTFLINVCESYYM